MKIIVKNCHDCPFCNNDNEDGYSCNFPNNNVEDFEMTDYNKDDLPVNCPLRNGDTIVTIKTS